MFNIEEIKAWEEEVDLTRFNNWKKEKRYFDPAKQRLYKRRTNHYISSGHFYSKECPYEQHLSRRQYRNKMNGYLRTGQYEKIRPFQNTGGWNTW